MEVIVTRLELKRMDQKDRSIMVQVAAKIAADLTPLTLNVSERNTPEEVANLFVRTFSVVVEGMFDGHAEIETKWTGSAVKSSEASRKAYDSGMSVAEVAERFNAVVENEPILQVRVAGKQHGDLPPWLHGECLKKGTIAVFDNRDKLAQNPKRPWFVDADNRDNAYWPPR